MTDFCSFFDLGRQLSCVDAVLLIRGKLVVVDVGWSGVKSGVEDVNGAGLRDWLL
jgi:hypothetical protein